MQMRTLMSRRRRLSTLIALTLAAAPRASAAPRESYELLFAAMKGRTSLVQEGFQFKMDADRGAKTRIDVGKDGLTIETLARAEPLLAKPDILVSQPAELSVSWGVRRYPAGADWSAGVNNEAIMIMVFFGTEKYYGGLFVPASPYFIGFFLCDAGPRGSFLVGRSYSKQGRYICLDGPLPGKEITSTVALDENFRRAFGVSEVPAVTGLAIEADTTQVSGDGASSAWVKSVSIRPYRQAGSAAR